MAATKYPLGPVSAYAIAKAHGFDGTEAEWLESLHASVSQVGEWISEHPDVLREIIPVKGTVATMADLPATGNELNDTYYVQSEKYRVTWTGTQWVQSSMAESDYTSDLAAAAATANDALTAVYNTITEQGFGDFDLADQAGTTGYGLREDGTTRAYDAFTASDYIPVIPGSTIRLLIADGPAWTFDTGAYGHVFYDSGKNVVRFNALDQTPVFTVPANAVYMRVTALTAYWSASYVSRAAGIIDSVTRKMDAAIEASEIIKDQLNGGGENLLAGADWVPNALLRNNTGAVVTGRTGYAYTGNYIPVIPGATIELNWTVQTANYAHAWYDSAKQYLSSQRMDRTRFKVPDSAAYIRVNSPKGTTDGTGLVMTQTLTVIADMQSDIAALQEAIGGGGTAPDVRTTWLAIGDSITAGVYSQTSGDSEDETISPLSRETGWAHLAATARGYDFTNGGFRGLGFVQTGAPSGRNNPDWPVSPSSGDRISPSEIWGSLPDVPDYDLVTVALGVNDYNNNIPLGDADSTAGDGTIRGGIKAAIAAVTAQYPSARIVFVTPLDCVVSATGSLQRGRDTQKHGRTLTDVAGAIREECAVYDIEVVDVTAESPLRDWNIRQLLPDRVHPSLSCHRILAGWLGQKLGL